MITSANLTLTELKQMWLELFLNKTDKVSDISDDSVLNATAYGCSKVAQKAIKDIAIVEVKLFPKYAKGTYLDDSAQLFGAEARRGATGSSTYLLVKATVGTQYIATTHTFKNSNGITFEMEDDFTVDNSGFGYIKVRSIDTGVKTNVNANTVNSVVPVPTGHIGVINEYMAVGGADAESDDVFRNRILTSKSYLSKTTIDYYTQILQSLDDRVLKIYNMGRNEDGMTVFHIATQNGASLTNGELETLLDQFKEYLPITELNKFGDVIGVLLENIEYHYIGGATVGIDFRVQIDPNYNTDDVRKNIQINISKKFDFRTWKDGSRVEWDDILDIVKSTEGVRYVWDDYFYPNSDESVSWGKLPRVQKFVMRDLNGVIIYDSNGNLSPIFYPSE